MARMIKMGRIIPRLARANVTFTVAASNSTRKIGADYVCTGSNDQATINAAINDLPDTGGKVVLMDGTYNLTDSIIINKGQVVLQGQGKNTILVGGVNQTTPLIQVGDGTNGYEDVWIKDLNLFGGQMSAGAITGAIYLNGGSGDNNKFCRIIDCMIASITGDGIHVSYSPFTWISGCTIRGITQDGIEITNASTDCYVVDNYIDTVSGYGINISDAGSTNCMVYGNQISNANLGSINDATSTYYGGLPLLESRSLAFGTWEKVAEVNVTTNSDYVDFTGLDINTDGVYVIFVNVKNPLTGDISLLIYFEGDYTTANYYSERIYADGTTLNASRTNSPVAVYIFSGQSTVAPIYVFRDPDGYPHWVGIEQNNYGATARLNLRGGAKTSTVTNITSIRLAASSSGGIGAGSRFMLCKVRTK